MLLWSNKLFIAVSLSGNLYGLEKFWAFLKYYKVSDFYSLFVISACLLWNLALKYLLWCSSCWAWSMLNNALKVARRFGGAFNVTPTLWKKIPDTFFTNFIWNSEVVKIWFQSNHRDACVVPFIPKNEAMGRKMMGLIDVCLSWNL